MVVHGGVAAELDDLPHRSPAPFDGSVVGEGLSRHVHGDERVAVDVGVDGIAYGLFNPRRVGAQPLLASQHAQENHCDHDKSPAGSYVSHDFSLLVVLASGATLMKITPTAKISARETAAPDSLVNGCPFSMAVIWSPLNPSL